MLNKQTKDKMLTKNTLRTSANAGGYKIKGASFSTLTDIPNKIKVWYSYATPVAITDMLHNTTYVSVNNWSVTTAKHLNEIEARTNTDKRLRLAPQDWLTVKILFGVADRNTLQGESFKSPADSELAAANEARDLAAIQI